MIHSYHQKIIDLLAPLVKLPDQEIENTIEFPPQENQGDRAIACFRFAKTLKKSPQEIATLWAEQINKQPLPIEIEQVQAMGGYLNFYFSTNQLAKDTLDLIFKHPGQYEQKPVSQDKKVVIEFSSPNIAKPFSIGHLRSTNLGACLSRVYQYLGFSTVRINHLGDWGTQFGKLIVAYQRWGNAEMLDQNPIQALFELYVKFHQEEQEDVTLTTQAREAFSKLEKGDEKTKELWDWFRNLTLKELDRLYQLLGVEFDHLWGESFYMEHVPSVMKALDQAKLSKQSDGALIVDLKKEKLGVAVLQKGDESSLYITRDLAAAIYRYQQFHFEKMIYVVGSEQSLHFQQLFCLLEKLKHPFAKQCTHVAFGQITFGSEKMSTRKGNVVFLQDVLERAQERARQIIEEKNPDLENPEEIAKQVSLGAILFADLSAKRIKNVKFEWDEILSFEGETGPYLQYCYVRTLSLIEKYAKDIFADVSLDSYQDPACAKLIRTLSKFRFALEKVTGENEPFYLGKYLLDLSKDFNRFYQSCRILDQAPEIQASRMTLVFSVSSVLKIGLDLLGIPTPKKM